MYCLVNISEDTEGNLLFYGKPMEFLSISLHLVSGTQQDRRGSGVYPDSTTEAPR